MPLPPKLQAGNSINNETFLSESNGLADFGIRTNNEGKIDNSLIGGDFSHYYTKDEIDNLLLTDESCFTFSDGTITDYICTVSVIIIPPTIGGEAVTNIESNAFNNNQLTSVTIPDSVTSIGEYAFYNNNLTSVTIGNSVESIGDYAFSDNKLSSVTIPDSVTSIGEGVFSGNDLTSVTIPDSVTSIERSVFYDNKLTSVTIPDSVTSIGYYAFQSNDLTSVSIKSGTSYSTSSFDPSCTVTLRP